MGKKEDKQLAYIAKIDTHCCEHKTGKGYLLGYTGFKCCKVAMCCDCDGRQFVGGWFGKLLYPLAKKIWRNRLEVIAKIELDRTGGVEVKNENYED